MQIKSLGTLKAIFSSIVAKRPKRVSFLLVNTNNRQWRGDFKKQLLSQKPNSLLAVALIVKHIEDPERIDSYLFICRRNQLNKQYFQCITNNITGHKKDETQPGILDFLKKRWQINQSSYVALFWWTTRVQQDFTLIAYQAIAPAYRNQGLMKIISLKLIGILNEQYGEKHLMRSFVNHPATYLFFNPHDKILKQYEPSSLEECTCSALLEMHEIIKPPATLPLVSEALVQQGFLSNNPPSKPIIELEEEDSAAKKSAY